MRPRIWCISVHSFSQPKGKLLFSLQTHAIFGCISDSEVWRGGCHGHFVICITGVLSCAGPCDLQTYDVIYPTLVHGYSILQLTVYCRILLGEGNQTTQLTDVPVFTSTTISSGNTYMGKCVLCIYAP